MLLQTVRLVQILEQRGVPFEFFRRCADKGLEWLNSLQSNQDNQKHFFEEVLKRHKHIITMKEKDDIDNDDILYRMASAELEPSEPYYAEQRRKFIKKTADKIRKKVRHFEYW